MCYVCDCILYISLYACMCVCMYVCMHVRMYVYMYVRTYVYMNVRMYVRILYIIQPQHSATLESKQSFCILTFIKKNRKQFLGEVLVF